MTTSLLERLEAKARIGAWVLLPAADITLLLAAVRAADELTAWSTVDADHPNLVSARAVYRAARAALGEL